MERHGYLQAISHTWLRIEPNELPDREWAEQANPLMGAASPLRSAVPTHLSFHPRIPDFEISSASFESISLCIFQPIFFSRDLINRN